MALAWSNLNNSPVAVNLSWSDRLNTMGIGTGSLVNATVTSVLGMVGMIGTVAAGARAQRLYKKQEDAYINAAMEQARRLQLKGDIELRNLRYQHTIQQGDDELAVAAGAHGNLSGSFLDKLMANKKISDADERTSSLSTLWAVSDAKKQGYINAIRTAGQAELAAINTRAQVINTGISSIARAVDSLTQDVTAKKQIDARRELIYAQLDAKKQLIDYLYTPGKFNNIGAYTSAALIGAVNYNEEEETLGQGAYAAPPDTYKEGGLPYLQVAPDGSLINF